MSRPRLTTLAQARVAALLGRGGRAIDATMGNGHDTCFLARRVAPDGHVIAFDIQADAMRHTRERLRASELAPVATLHLRGHEHLLKTVPTSWVGTVDVVMFNLGYLPGGDKTVVTRPDTSLSALEQALTALRPGGLLSLLLYRDHAGGTSESTAIERWLSASDRHLTVERHDSPGPCLLLISPDMA